MRNLVFDTKIAGIVYGAGASNTSVRTTRNGVHGLLALDGKTII